MNKGSARRPGEIKPGAWEVIFAPKSDHINDAVEMVDVGICQCVMGFGEECDVCNLSIPAPKINTSGECVDAVNVTDWSQA